MRFLAILLLLLPMAAFAQPKVDLVRVDKSERRMELLSGGKVLRQFSIALGDNPIGHKQQEGDERTPEGRYLLDYRKPDSAYHRSIHISYPDARDIESARQRGVSPGGAIMIHGQRNGWGWAAPLMQRRDWTDGCIALSDADMDMVWELVGPGTAIEIVP